MVAKMMIMKTSRLLSILTSRAAWLLAISTPVLVGSLVVGVAAYGQAAPSATDARFGHARYKTPNPAVWTRSEEGGRLLFSVALPPPDFCTLTVFPSEPLSGTFKSRFQTAVQAELKREGVLTIEKDSGIQEARSSDGYLVLQRTLVGLTKDFHTVHLFLAGNPQSRFDLLAFQTSGEETWKMHGPEAAAFFKSVNLDNVVRKGAPVAPVGAGHTSQAPHVLQAAVGTTDAPAPTRPLHLPPLAPRPGYIIGRAVFADGRPIPHFEVSAMGFDGAVNLFPGTIPSLGGVTGTNGRYAFRVLDSFRHEKPIRAMVIGVDAVARIPYQNATYLLAMHPLDGKADGSEADGFRRDSGRGVVRDFVLKISGLHLQYVPNEESETRFRMAYYGGVVSLDCSVSNKDGANYEDETSLTRAVAGGSIEVTLTPTAPLVDGSTGRTIRTVVPMTAFKGGGNWHLSYIRNIPLGAYSATARLLSADGEARPLRVRDDIRPQFHYQPSIPVAWTPRPNNSSSLPDLLPNKTLYIGQ